MITEFTQTPTEIRSLGLPETEFRPVPVTIATGENLAKGTVLGRVTASGKYVAYDNVAGDGSEVASGILALAVDATDSDLVGTMYLGGAFVESALTGLDSNGKTDLNGRSVPGMDLFIF